MPKLTEMGPQQPDDMWLQPIALSAEGQFSRIDLPTKSPNSLRPLEQSILNFFMNITESCSPSELPETYPYEVSKGIGITHRSSVSKAMRRLRDYGFLIDRHEKLGDEREFSESPPRHYFILTPLGVGQAITIKDTFDPTHNRLMQYRYSPTKK